MSCVRLTWDVHCVSVFLFLCKTERFAQEPVKIDEPLGVKQNRMPWKSVEEYSIINQTVFPWPSGLGSMSSMFIKIHTDSIHIRYWCAFCRRKLRADVTAAFPTLGTDQVSELVPGKEELNVVKLYAHRGEAVTVYVSGGNPILFELEKNLYPTGMTVGWRWPSL